MKSKFFQKCCRLCLDETKEQMEIGSVEKLAETLQQLYNLKIESEDRCSKNICVDCYTEAKETEKWLTFHEKQKKVVLANQQRFEEELFDQLGPPPPSTPPVPTASTRAERITRRSARVITDDDDDPPKKLSPIKKERIITRRLAKSEWEPSARVEQDESETPSDEVVSDDDEEEEEEEEETSETGTTSTDADELKCPKCETVFTDIRSLEKHSCEFACSICSTVLRYKNNLRRHLISVHKISSKQWLSYWNPKSDSESQGLLVETSKPKKRYRYESDSPTDIEEDSNSDGAAGLLKEISCNHCGDRFDTNEQLKEHDCDYGCNICGYTFASRGNVKKHKIRVHKIDPNSPALLTNRTASRSASRTASRPPSRAASEKSSEDEPLAALATRNSDDNGTPVDRAKTPVKQSFKYYCTDCDYSNSKRYRVTSHIISVHNIPKDLVDIEAIVREPLVSNSRTSLRSRTPNTGSETRSRSTPGPAETPKSSKDESAKTNECVEPPVQNPEPVPNIEQPEEPMRKPEPAKKRTQAKIPVQKTTPSKNREPAKTPEAAKSVSQQSGQHRSRSRSTGEDRQGARRSRSTFDDSLEIGQKRKRSLSACSNKSSRMSRSRSNPPPDRPVLLAKRRISTSCALAKVQTKLRPTMIGMESNRLHVTIIHGCGNVTHSHQFRIRAMSHVPKEPCPTRRLQKLRPPVGNEREHVHRLRSLFRSLSNRISSLSKVNAIDVDSLVLDPVSTSPVDPLLTEQDPLQRNTPAPEQEQYDSPESEQEESEPIISNEDVQVVNDEESAPVEPMEVETENAEEITYKQKEAATVDIDQPVDVAKPAEVTEPVVKVIQQNEEEQPMEIEPKEESPQRGELEEVDRTKTADSLEKDDDEKKQNCGAPPQQAKLDESEPSDKTDGMNQPEELKQQQENGESLQQDKSNGSESSDDNEENESTESTEESEDEEASETVILPDEKQVSDCENTEQANQAAIVTESPASPDPEEDCDLMITPD